MAGIFGRRLGEPARSALTVYAYLSSPTLSSPTDCPIAPPLLEVRDATADDLPLIEKQFVHHGTLVEWLAEDGTAAELTLPAMTQEYRRHGLARRRRILMAERGGRPCGVALLELSSFGLNLSEVTNRCTLHLWDDEPAAAVALAERARRLYRDEGYPFCILLAPPALVPALTAAGFSHSRDYACWTLHRSLFPEYFEYVEGLFG